MIPRKQFEVEDEVQNEIVEIEVKDQVVIQRKDEVQKTNKRKNQEKSNLIPPNPPVLIFTTGMNISRCAGCHLQITRQQQEYPHNMVFRKRGVVGYLNKKLDRYCNKETNIHFHLNRSCI